MNVFDIFSSKEIGKDKRSFGYSLTFRSPERTLKDEDVNRAVGAVAEALKRELGVEVRGI